MRAAKETVEKTLSVALEDQWLALTLRDPVPFSDPSLEFLLGNVPDRHFLFVATVRWRFKPVSLVLRLQRTVTEVGKQFRSSLGTEGKAQLGRWINRPIELHPLTDLPIITMRGERACSHDEALQIARHLTRFSWCPALYRIDRGLTGSA